MCLHAKWRSNTFKCSSIWFDPAGVQTYDLCHSRWTRYHEAIDAVSCDFESVHRLGDWSEIHFQISLCLFVPAELPGGPLWVFRILHHNHRLSFFLINSTVDSVGSYKKVEVSIEQSVIVVQIIKENIKCDKNRAIVYLTYVSGKTKAVWRANKKAINRKTLPE